MKEIYYEKHPVSEQRKAELTNKGYKILDARFAPKDWEDPFAPKPKRKVASKKTVE